MELTGYNIVISAGAALGFYTILYLLQLLYKQWTSPLHIVPGPKPTHWFSGNLGEIMKANNSTKHFAWIEEFGNTFTYTILFRQKRLCTVDHKAIAYILSHNNEYQKPAQIRQSLADILGEGVLFVEGEQHKQQRKIMNPAFGPMQVRALTEIFVEKAVELKDRWNDEYNKRSAEQDAVRIDVLSWLSRMTLDVIGLAGFNYNFNSLNPENPHSELSLAFKTMFKAGSRITAFTIMQVYFPVLRYIPTERGRKIAQAQKTMNRIGKELLAESKAALANSDSDSKTEGRRDLLSLLVKANTSKDVPENMRLSDEDVLAQVPTFLVAGHETTSTGTTWALFALTQNVEAQTKLREELLGLGTDNPDMDQLNSLPYLDAVVREALRVHSPVPSTARVAMKDDMIPLESPYVDKNGVTQSFVKVAKGDTIFLPILPVNHSTAIWGPDAKEFKPERWLEKMDEKINSIPGVWGNQMTFLAGARACIGYRFSLVEMKALLFTLVKAFEFELAVPASDVLAKQNVVQRPVLASNIEAGNQLPLLIKPYQAK